MSHLRLDTVMVSTIPVRTFFDGMLRFLHFFTPQQNTIFEIEQKFAKKVKTLGNQVLSRVAKTLNTHNIMRGLCSSVAVCVPPLRRRFREEGFRVEHGKATPDEAEMDKIDTKVSL